MGFESSRLASRDGGHGDAGCGKEVAWVSVVRLKERLQRWKAVAGTAIDFEGVRWKGDDVGVFTEPPGA